MICKSCGKEIDDDSLFCPCCGKDVSDLSNSYYDKENCQSEKLYRKSNLKILSITLIFITIIVSIMLLYENGSQKYYNRINDTINYACDNFDFEGEQIISNIDVNYVSQEICCKISPNNMDLQFLLENGAAVEDNFSITEAYCVYDFDNQCFCFENDDYIRAVNVTPRDIESSENAYNSCIKRYDDINSFTQDNCVYRICYCVQFGALKPDGILEKLYYKNTMVNLKKEAEYDSYFVFKDGVFKPLLLSDNLNDYVNAVWKDTDLNLIKYDEKGNCYLEGPIKTREKARINNKEN